MQQIKLSSVQINSSYNGNNQLTLNTRGQQIVSISITCLSPSVDNLLIGFNEDPSTKFYLQAGQSVPLGPYNDDQYINDNQIKFLWEGNNAANSAVIVIASVGDNPICLPDQE